MSDRWMASLAESLIRCERRSRSPSPTATPKSTRSSVSAMPLSRATAGATATAERNLPCAMLRDAVALSGRKSTCAVLRVLPVAQVLRRKGPSRRPSPFPFPSTYLITTSHPTHRPPSTVHRPPSTAHRPPPTAHRPPPAARLEVRKHGQPDEAGPRPVRAAGRFRQVAARASRALGTDAGQRQRTQPDAHTARWLASRPRPPPGIAWPAGGGWRTRLDRMRGGVKGEQRGTS
jgi:hypothetical protein